MDGQARRICGGSPHVSDVAMLLAPKGSTVSATPDYAFVTP